MNNAEATTHPHPHLRDTVRDIVIVIALLATAISLALTGHETHAATALGGALAFALPGVRRVPAGAVILGMAAATVGLAGCTASDVALAHKLTCDVARVACAACGVSGVASSGGEESEASIETP